jgi:hypothetical protein
VTLQKKKTVLLAHVVSSVIGFIFYFFKSQDPVQQSSSDIGFAPLANTPTLNSAR